MALQFASIASGSNGNCYYIGNEREAVFIDAGITCRETERRMIRAGLTIEKVRAIFISHEHSDHTRGAEVLSRRYHLPIYITPTTLRHSSLNLNTWLTIDFSAGVPVQIGDLTIMPFGKNHDGRDPHSFTVSGEGVTVGVFTDIGEPCEQVTRHFSECDAAFLEANYDEQMLLTGHYPWFLKNRIRSDHGHLSNDQSLNLFLTHGKPGLSHLILSHLSHENNHPEKVWEKFLPHALGRTIHVASRFEESPVFTIGSPRIF